VLPQDAQNLVRRASANQKNVEFEWCGIWSLNVFLVHVCPLIEIGREVG